MGVILQRAVEAPRVHEISRMVYTALTIQIAIWFHFGMLNFTKKLFSLYIRYIIFEGGVGGQKKSIFFYFFFSLIFVSKGIQIYLGRLTFLKKVFLATLRPRLWADDQIRDNWYQSVGLIALTKIQLQFPQNFLWGHHRNVTNSVRSCGSRI